MRADIIHSNTHLPTLDGLRGVAIVLVMMHSLVMFGESHTVAAELVKSVFTFGWVGVQLFFVLSGFLITGILLDTRRSANYFKSFFARRMLRIFPLYYGTLIIAFVLLPAIGALPELFQRDASHQARFWFYLSNWYRDNGDAFPHYWSLAVEEQFYLLWPLVVYFCAGKRLLKVCAGIAVAGFAIRVGMQLEGYAPELIYTVSLCRMDALALGAAAAVVLRDPAMAGYLRNRVREILLCAGAAMLASVLMTHSHGMSFIAQTVGYGTLSLAFALTVLGAALADSQQLTAGWRNLLASRPLRTLGKYSYGMYVFQHQLHKLVGEPLMQMLPASFIGSAVVTVIYVIAMGLVTLGVAMLSYHLFEMPFLRMKDKFVVQARPGGDTGGAGRAAC